MASELKVLVVDDEADVLDLIQRGLRGAGYLVSTANNGAEVLTRVRSDRPDLLILDLMLPKLSGLEVCKLLKKDPATSAIPIIMLTAKAEEMDRIIGLELGADDYVTKPFSPRELILRVQSVLRRGNEKSASQEKVIWGQLSLDHSRHEVLLEGELLDLTATEFKLLSILLERRGRVQSRDRLLNDVWGYESAIDTRTVDTHVRRLRAKLGTCADYIETLRGVGYRMSDTLLK